MPKKYKIFEAKYPFICIICKKEHPEGIRAFFNEQQQIASADCQWPQKKGSINIVFPYQANSSLPPVKAKAAVEGRLQQQNHLEASGSSVAAIEPKPLINSQKEVMLKASIVTIRDNQAFKEIDTADLMPLIAIEYSARLLQQSQEFKWAMAQAVQHWKLKNMGLME